MPDTVRLLSDVCAPPLPLPLLQPELQRVLYPVFVHIYLQLVSYGASQKAAELLQKYRCVPAVSRRRSPVCFSSQPLYRRCPALH